MRVFQGSPLLSVPAAPEPVPSPFSSLGVLAVLEGRSAWGPVRARLLYGGEGVFLTSGLYWTHLLCWIPFRVAPFSLDAPAVLGGSAWDPSKGAIALWGPRILFPLGVLAASGAPPSLSPWACLLRRNPFRALPLPGRVCCMGLRLAFAALRPQSWDCL